MKWLADKIKAWFWPAKPIPPKVIAQEAWKTRNSNASSEITHGPG